MTAKILVVDDEPLLEYVIQQHFREKIRSNELVFSFASNGRQALEQLESDPQIGVVLTDINMPEMDGLDLLSHLKEKDSTLKAVVVSAYGDLANIRTAMNRGAFDFLTKPIDFNDLELTLQRSLESVQQTRADVTQLQQAQTYLIQSEKLASIGELVAGITHEITNPVTFILGNVEHAENYFHDLINVLNLYRRYCVENIPRIQAAIEAVELDFVLEDLPKLLNSMREGTERLDSICKSMRTFVRADTSAKELFDIHEGISSTLIILKHRLKANDSCPEIEVVTDYGDLPLVECYPGQLNQVFMNILANAIDALEDYNLSRTEAEIQANPSRIYIRTEAIANYKIVIHIADNGPGMTEEVRQKLFDPFFTTKPVGKGTGLGLSISYQIVVWKHNGQLKCNSKQSQGTEFVIEIPRHQPSIQANTQE
ncbi:sensor histidine kinase [Allocoleopsis sp.]|uniref:sensor histidine kinase n=1 Tax=Allocoleopsis sp. TaxID=3088169 RepID=UPI002FD68A70